MYKQAIDILQDIWGYKSFKPGQEDIINRILVGDNILALLPTGGGKSLCYQVPALCRKGICIVVSPLISLMQDQVQGLKKKKVNAEAIYSGLSHSLIDTILDNCIHGDVKLLYVSPERLHSELFLERLNQMDVQFIAVDEAHCISQWGYDFRPSYLNIQEIREILPGAQIIALTATAPPAVAQDICKNLDIPLENIIHSDFTRPNLHYFVIPSPDKEQKLYDLLRNSRGHTIIYCRRRSQCDMIARALRKRGIQALSYHAGYSSTKRSDIQEKFMNSEVRVIAATTAFGMGIDKSDVRYVYHLTAPMSPEEYFQEAGRAGRDGKEAWCVLFYNDDDKKVLWERIAQAFPPRDFIKQLYRSLAVYFQLAYGSGEGENFDFDIDEFCTRFKYKKIQTYYGLKFIEKSGWITLAEGIHRPSRLRIIMNRNDLYNQQLRDRTLDTFIQYLLRSYEGLFSGFTVVHEMKIARELEIQKGNVVKYLKMLNEHDIIEYQAAESAPQITFLEPIAREDRFTIDKDLYFFLKKRSESRLESMIEFAEADKCREMVMLDYFGQESTEECGRCDICLGSRIEIPDENEKKMIFHRLKKYLAHNKSRSVLQLLDMFPIIYRHRVLYTINKLEDVGWLSIDDNQNVKRNEK